MTDTTVHPVGEGVPGIRNLHLRGFLTAPRFGLRDFLQKPAMGLFFGATYVLGGRLLYLFLFVIDQVWLAIPITVGFPLLGPFLAVGLYEISRRLEAGQTA